MPLVGLLEVTEAARGVVIDLPVDRARGLSNPADDIAGQVAFPIRFGITRVAEKRRGSEAF